MSQSEKQQDIKSNSNGRLQQNLTVFKEFMSFVVDFKEFISIIFSGIAIFSYIWSPVNIPNFAFTNIRIPAGYILILWLFGLYSYYGWLRMYWNKHKTLKKYNNSFGRFVFRDIIIGFQEPRISISTFLFIAFWVLAGFNLLFGSNSVGLGFVMCLLNTSG